MRFVSKFPNLGLGAAIPEKFVVTFGGDREKQTESVAVTFSQTGLVINDVKYALAQWPEKEFTGRWLDEDEITLQPITERIGVFDTDDQGWDTETREKVEAWILAKPNYGLDFVQIKKVPAVAPWATYDRMHHSKIAAYAIEGGLVDAALEYEIATKNRVTVIAALQVEVPVPVEPGEGELIAA